MITVLSIAVAILAGGVIYLLISHLRLKKDTMTKEESILSGIASIRQIMVEARDAINNVPARITEVVNDALQKAGVADKIDPAAIMAAMSDVTDFSKSLSAATTLLPGYFDDQIATGNPMGNTLPPLA